MPDATEGDRGIVAYPCDGQEKEGVSRVSHRAIRSDFVTEILLLSVREARSAGPSPVKKNLVCDRMTTKFILAMPDNIAPRPTAQAMLEIGFCPFAAIFDRTPRQNLLVRVEQMAGIQTWIENL